MFRTIFCLTSVTGGLAVIKQISAQYVHTLKIYASAVEDNAQQEWMAPPISSPEERRRRMHDKTDMPLRMELLILKAQKQFVDNLQQVEDDVRISDKHKFIVDRWERPNNEGGGISCVLQDSVAFEKAGVNVSVVRGRLPPAAIKQMKSRGQLELASENDQMPFYACGISSVIHPRNPAVPTLHFNYRYFQVWTADKSGEKAGKEGEQTEDGGVQTPSKLLWWFGGGCDLTPYYLCEEDATYFHRTLRDICDSHGGKDYYTRFKAWCDTYFRIEHRDICRGVGGIFFDDLCEPDQESCFQFVQAHALAVSKLYIPLVRKNMFKGYGRREREWQLIRRGHYTEFNLIYDRGTKFGLYTPGARHESILVSLPLYAKWEYMHEPEPGSEEDKLVTVLRKPREWV